MKRLIIILTFLGLLSQIEAKAQLVLSANKEYGQIYDLVYDKFQEGTLYARTVGNHIVKSTDNGEEWEILYSDSMEEYSTLKQLRLINEGTSLSFIVSAEGTTYNKLVLINPEDGTITKEFEVPNSFETDILIASYDIYEDNNIAVINTSFSINYGFTNEVFRTEDGGISWESIYYSPDHNDIVINNVAIFPDNPDRIFLMRGGSPTSDQGGLLVSQDAGNTWQEKIPGNTYSAIAFDPENANDIFLGTFYGYGTHEENLYRSTDGGENWNIIPITWTSMSNDHINYIAFNPRDSNNIIVLEENEIAITYDNGNIWQNFVYTEIDPEQYYYGLSLSFNPFNTEEVVISADFYPFRSLDGGENLMKLKNPFVNSTGRIDSHFNGSENHLYYGLRSGFIHRNIDENTEHGYRIQELNNNYGEATFPYADKEVSGRIFNSGRFGMNSLVEMSEDHGENYVLLHNSSSYLNIYELATSPSNTNEVWFSFGDSAYKIDVTDPETPVVGEITLPSLDFLYGLIIDPNNSSKVTISQGAKIYITTNGGMTWIDSSSGLESLDPSMDMIVKLVINPFNSQEYLLASTKGIFISEDQGLTWSQIFDEFVENITFSTLTNGHIVATNHYSDGYMFPESPSRIIYSVNHGETWEIISGEALDYLNSTSSTYRFNEDEIEVYFGTFDMGLVSYTIELDDLSINDHSIGATNILLYPNPSTGFINLKGNGLKRISIFSMTGQLVLDTTENLQRLNISGLLKGIYLVKIETAEGLYFKKILKN